MPGCCGGGGLGCVGGGNLSCDMAGWIELRWRG